MGGVIRAACFVLVLGAPAMATAQESQVAPRLSGEGESCRTRADCLATLDCVQETCSLPGQVAPRLGGVGESCRTRADCLAKLECAQETCSRPVLPHTKSPLLAIGGVFVIVAGLGTTVGGSFMVLWGVNSHACTDRGCDPPPIGWIGWGAALYAVAAGAIVGGVAMMVIGLKQEPRVRDKRASIWLAPGGLAGRF